MMLHQVQYGVAVLVHGEPLPLPLQARVPKPNPIQSIHRALQKLRSQKKGGIVGRLPGGGGGGGRGGDEEDAALVVVDEARARPLRSRSPKLRHGAADPAFSLGAERAEVVSSAKRRAAPRESNEVRAGPRSGLCKGLKGPY